MREPKSNSINVCSGHYPRGLYVGRAECFVGRHVKIAFDITGVQKKEFMWVKVLATYEGDLIGVLENDPNYADIQNGDPVRCATEDVLAVK